MYEMLLNGLPVLVYDPYTAIKEGFVFNCRSVTLYKGDNTMIKLPLNTRIEYMILLGYLEDGWGIFK